VRRFVVLILGVLAFSSVADAQSAKPSGGNGYVEGVAQSAFGNVASQSYGVEVGLTVAPKLQVFVDAGRVNDTSPSSLGVSAQLIAGFLAQTQSNVTFSNKEPVSFGLAGVRYLITSSAKVEPYVLAGGGLARARKNVNFAIAGSDVTGSLQQYGVQLGTDLSGAETKPMLTVGAGVVWPAWQRLILDFQYRYGRVFTSDQALNINRAGIGAGVRF
jgi:opacity protein-like surface antigen